MIPFKYFFEVTQKPTVIVEISRHDNLNVNGEQVNHDLLKTQQGYGFFEYSTSANNTISTNVLLLWILNTVTNF